MKSKFAQLTILLSVVPFLTQCVPSKDVNSLNLRVRSIDNRVVQLNKTVDKLNDPAHAGQIGNLERKQASMSNTLDAINMKILQIKGQLEESNHNYQMMQNNNAQLQAELSQKIADLADQLAILTDQFNQTNEQLNAVKQDSLTAGNQAKAAAEQAKAAITQAQMAEEQATAAKQAAMEANKKATSRHASAGSKSAPRKILPSQKKISPHEQKKVTASVKTKTSAGGEDNKLYDRALGLFRKSKFNESYRVFSSYLDKYPKGKLAANARFWMGDCYYNQQEYELAILEYQKVIADYPKNAKAPAALLKQGLAFEKLKDNDTAKIVYNKLLTEYPKSDQAATAKKRISILK